eukprot:2061754-Prymnesium_polylepis.1
MPIWLQGVQPEFDCHRCANLQLSAARSTPSGFAELFEVGGVVPNVTYASPTPASAAEIAFRAPQPSGSYSTATIMPPTPYALMTARLK